MCDVADIDECATNNGDCGSTAKCTNTEGSFECKGTCPPGYSGDGKHCMGKHTSRSTLITSQ